MSCPDEVYVHTLPSQAKSIGSSDLANGIEARYKVMDIQQQAVSALKARTAHALKVTAIQIVHAAL